MNGLIDVKQVCDLGNGWSFVEVIVPVTEQWPGFASVIVSPTGDIAIMGDGNTVSTEYEIDDKDHDIKWARRVIGKPVAVWAS